MSFQPDENVKHRYTIHYTGFLQEKEMSPVFPCCPISQAGPETFNAGRLQGLITQEESPSGNAGYHRGAVEKWRKVRNDLLSGWSVWNEAGPRRKSEDTEMIKSKIDRQPFV